MGKLFSFTSLISLLFGFVICRPDVEGSQLNDVTLDASSSPQKHGKMIVQNHHYHCTSNGLGRDVLKSLAELKKVIKGRFNQQNETFSKATRKHDQQLVTLNRQIKSLKKDIHKLKHHLCDIQQASLRLTQGKISHVLVVCRNAPSLGAAFGGRILDSSLTASSVFDQRFLAKYGRLNGPHSGWAPNSRKFNDYLQVDLGRKYWLCSVATQGRTENDEWTTKYKLSMSLDCKTWNVYEQNGAEKVFSGNSDRTSVVKHSFPIPTRARCIRFIPTASHGDPCLRVDVFGQL